ncbi:MAG: heavy metal translocating P-type ATPase [Chitinophagales bacterium]
MTIINETKPTQQEIKLHIEGMSCTNCALGISKYLEKKGFEEVKVNFSTGIAQVSILENAQIEEAKENIEKLGYTVVSIEGKDGISNSIQVLNDATDLSSTANFFTSFAALFNTRNLFITSAVLSLPLFLGMFLPFAFLHNPYVQLALATPVFLIGCVYFGRSAFYSILSGVPNMDVLVILGATAAFGFSLVSIFSQTLGKGLYFETSAIIITFVLLGKYMENRAVQQTTTAIKELTNLQKVKAKRIIDMDGEEVIEQIEADKLQKGDKVLVNTGDNVPADGKIFWGEAAIDESMISGESLPIEKMMADKVIGGTVLQQGSIKVEVTAAGNQSTLAQIIELVKAAQADQPPIQRLADRVSAVFVPVVIALASLTFLVAYFGFQLSFSVALMNSIAVLVVACPCAMGLATPTAMMVGMGEVAKSGILIKGGSTIEKLANLQQMVFDKTGTLTTGHFKIKQFDNLSDKEDNALKAIVLSLEKHSSHPIALSLTEALNDAPKKLLINIQEAKGLGMSGQDLDGNRYELGAYRMAKETTKDNTHQLYLLENKKLVATIDIEDELKEEAKSVIEDLLKMGIQPILLSGDRAPKVDEVAAKLGISEVYAEKLPQEKLEIVGKLSKESNVAMIGDGINDAPALAKVSVGISMSSATQIAIQSAQVVLLKGNLNLLTKTIYISQKILKTIKQNLFWAFFYNVMMIPLAAMGWLNPMLAAMAMSLSSIMVVGNSLRLKRMQNS